MKTIILAIFLTFIVPIGGIYYSKKNNEAFSFYVSISILIAGIWYLLLRITEKFLGYNYIYFTLTTLAYFLLVFLVFLLVKLNYKSVV